jgi:hypothetical protein
VVLWQGFVGVMRFACAGFKAALAAAFELAAAVEQPFTLPYGFSMLLICLHTLHQVSAAPCSAASLSLVSTIGML